MSSSIRHQVLRCLAAQRLSDAQIAEWKLQHPGRSIKQAMRAGKKVTAGTKVIVGKETWFSYLDVTARFFRQARALTGEKRLGNLLTPATLQRTFAQHYGERSQGHRAKIMAGIGHVYRGARTLGWVADRGDPRTQELRAFVKGLTEDAGVRAPRLGYRDNAVPLILADMAAHSRRDFWLAARVAVACGLRRNELAFLRSEMVDVERGVVTVAKRRPDGGLGGIGKGGRVRTVPIPHDLAAELDLSGQYVFGGTRSWGTAFYEAVRRSTRRLQLGATGVHRLRANCAQRWYREFREQSVPIREALRQVSRLLGHNRLDVLKSYIPEDMRE